MLDEKQKKIFELWKKNFTGSQIANEIGITRNAVMGILDRMRKKGIIGYKSPPKSYRQPVRNAHNPVPLSRAPQEPKTIRTEPDDDADQLVMTVLDDRSLPPHGPVTLMKLHHLSCRYIISDVKGAETLFCGKVKSVGAYCEEHRKLCYQPPMPKKKKPAFQFRS